jgi:hypothetical protein
MQTGRLLVCLMSLILSACSDLVLEPSGLDGTFSGTFTIINNKGITETGTVTFTFNGDRYSCTPGRPYFPPSGAGFLAIRGQTLILKDTVPHTAEFDWTLILSGSFSFAYDGLHLVLKQEDQEYGRQRMVNLTRQVVSSHPGTST